jgi:N-acetylneuraminate lyase
MTSASTTRLGTPRLEGLIAATHTPMDAQGDLELDGVPRQLEHLLGMPITAAFISGSTGEGQSLTVEERHRLTARWCQAAKGTPMRVVAHVGTNSINEAASLASEAQKQGVSAIAALSPSYFRPRSVEDLVDAMAMVAAAAPATAFYFYDIPSMTGVQLSMPAFLEQASRKIPNLVGMKFTNMDLASYTQCLQLDDGLWDLPFGCDEALLPALALGARGAVGSGYNFVGEHYSRLIDAWREGDLTLARRLQCQGIQLVQRLAPFGYLPAAKVVMEWLGVPVGPTRLPLRSLTEPQRRQLREGLESDGWRFGHSLVRDE